MNGICHWFFRNNQDDRHIRHCRYGSLCKYKHLTQDEVRILSSESQHMQSCRRCHGTGTQHIQVLGLKMAESFGIQCISCNGSGQINSRSVIIEKLSDRDWCYCRVPSRDTIYFPDNRHPKCSKHCYVCRNCNGITQIG